MTFTAGATSECLEPGTVRVERRSRRAADTQRSAAETELEWDPAGIEAKAARATGESGDILDASRVDLGSTESRVALQPLVSRPQVNALDRETAWPGPMTGTKAPRQLLFQRMGAGLVAQCPHLCQQIFHRG